jgi:formylglycine-generating enzyme required for sulfatase activity
LTPSPLTASPTDRIVTNPASRRGTPKTSPTCENPAHRSNVKWLKGLPSFKCHSSLTLKPNEFGLFDTLGNASEWTLDLYQFSKEKKKLVPLDGGEGLSHQMSNVRGGRYSTHHSEINSAYEFRCSLTSLMPGIGFRFAKSKSLREDE